MQVSASTRHHWMLQIMMSFVILLFAYQRTPPKECRGNFHILPGTNRSKEPSGSAEKRKIWKRLRMEDAGTTLTSMVYAIFCHGMTKRNAELTWPLPDPVEYPRVHGRQRRLKSRIQGLRQSVRGHMDPHRQRTHLIPSVYGPFLRRDGSRGNGVCASCLEGQESVVGHHA